MSSSQGSLARRYARAIVGLGREEKALDLFQEDLQKIHDLFQTYDEIYEILGNPSFPKTKRLAVLDELLGKLKIQGTIKNFCALLLKRERISVLPDIVHEYGEMLDEIQGVARATVLTASELSKGTVQRIEKMLSHSLQKKVVTSMAVDPELIGGLVLEIDNKVYDASIRSELKRLREKLVQETT